jgi:hypothetical protein
MVRSLEEPEPALVPNLTTLPAPTRALEATGRQGTIGATPENETRLECSLVYIVGEACVRLWEDRSKYIFRYANSVLPIPLDRLCPFQEISSIGLQGASGFLVSNGTC